MITKKWDKIYYIVIAFILAFSLTVSIGNAQEMYKVNTNQQGNINQEQLVKAVEKYLINEKEPRDYLSNKIKEDCKSMDAIGITESDIKDVMEENGDLKYKMCLTGNEGEEIDAIWLIENKYGDCSNIDIDEKGKKDKVSVYDNGELFINGSKVIYSVLQNEVDDKTPLITSGFKRSYNCPKLAGKSSWYTYHVSKMNVTQNLELEKKIENYTVSALALAISLIPGVNTIIGIAASAATAIISNELLSKGNLIKSKRSWYYDTKTKMFSIRININIKCRKEKTNYYAYSYDKRREKKLIKVKTTTTYYSNV